MMQTAWRWMCLLLLATLWLRPAAAGDLPALQQFLSEHYLIHTDLPREEVVPFGRHMDAVFAQYERRFSHFRVRDSQPMPLYLFRRQEDYLAFLSRHGINATNSGGIFFVRPHLQGLATWTSGHSRSETFAILQHEGFHQFAWNRIGHALPVWINEGLAQYFEDAIIVGQRMTSGLANGRRIELVQAAQRDARLISLQELISYGEQDWSSALADDPNRAALMYAQSWSAVYYLVHGEEGRLQPAFGLYLHLVSKGQPSPRAFEAAFGVNDISRVESRWRRYISRLQPDPVNAAAMRLEFLAAALRFLHERGEPTPNDIDQLRRNLDDRRFSVTRSSHGVATVARATDARMFSYERDNGVVASFQMLEPARADLPPRIEAPGLRPTPMLVWRRDGDGQLVQEIEYR